MNISKLEKYLFRAIDRNGNLPVYIFTADKKYFNSIDDLFGMEHFPIITIEDRDDYLEDDQFFIPICGESLINLINFLEEVFYQIPNIIDIESFKKLVPKLMNKIKNASNFTNIMKTDLDIAGCPRYVHRFHNEFGSFMCFFDIGYYIDPHIELGNVKLDITILKLSDFKKEQIESKFEFSILNSYLFYAFLKKFDPNLNLKEPDLKIVFAELISEEILEDKNRYKEYFYTYFAFNENKKIIPLIMPTYDVPDQSFQENQAKGMELFPALILEDFFEKNPILNLKIPIFGKTLRLLLDLLEYCLSNTPVLINRLIIKDYIEDLKEKLLKKDFLDEQIKDLMRKEEGIFCAIPFSTDTGRYILYYYFDIYYDNTIRVKKPIIRCHIYNMEEDNPSYIFYITNIGNFFIDLKHYDPRFGYAKEIIDMPFSGIIEKDDDEYKL